MLARCGQRDDPPQTRADREYFFHFRKIREEFIGAYCASKFGVIGLTQALAKELARHLITVNAVCPGYIWTPMWEEMARWFQENFPSLADKSVQEIFENRVKSVTPCAGRRPLRTSLTWSLFLVSEEAGISQARRST